VSGEAARTPRSSGNPETVEIFLQLPPGDIVFIKLIVEAHEGIGVLRTLDRKRAVIVVMVAADMETDARVMLESLRDQVPWIELPGFTDEGRS
jgi:chemotaxis response regulator CheB